jgi:hypothetical protein
MAKKQGNQKFDDHLFVALSIIIGFAITSALESWTLIIKNLATIEMSYFHYFWSAWAFFYAIQFWWGLWKYQDIQWNFREFLLFLSMAIIIFLLNDLIYPEIVSGEAILLREYFFAVRPWFFGLFSILLGLTLVRSIRIAKRTRGDRINIAYYFSIILGILATLSDSVLLHNAGIALGAGLFLFITGRAALQVSLSDEAG